MDHAGPVLSHHEFDIETKGTFPLAPLGERGDRKAGGEGVFTKMEFVRRSSHSKGKRQKWNGIRVDRISVGPRAFDPLTRPALT